MKRKGTILLEVIIGLFFIGILASICLPILTTALVNFNRIENRYEMNYIGELIVEKLKSPSQENMDVLQIVDLEGSVNYICDEFDSDKYSCEIKKIKSSANLLEILVKISDNKGKENYVEYKASIPKK